jgi:hypothetical protein
MTTLHASRFNALLMGDIINHFYQIHILYITVAFLQFWKVFASRIMIAMIGIAFLG